MSSQHPSATPVKWKYWLVMTAVIWPLSWLIPALVDLVLFFQNLQLSPVAAQGFSAAIIAGLIVFLISPALKHFMWRWLTH